MKQIEPGGLLAAASAFPGSRPVVPSRRGAASRLWRAGAFHPSTSASAAPPVGSRRHLPGARLLLASMPDGPMLTLVATRHHHHRLPPTLIGHRNCLLGRTTNSAIVSVRMELTDASFLQSADWGKGKECCAL